MRTVRTKVYSFNELSKEAQQNVISKMYDINVDFEWWEFTYNDAASVGIKIKSFDIDRGSYCNIDIESGAEYTANKIINEHGEQCETYILSAEYLKERDNVVDTAPKDENGDFEDEYELDSILDEIEDEYKKSLEGAYLRILSNEYEYLTSEEAVKQTIIANEYEFTIDGKQF